VPALIGLASVVCSYSRISLLGLAVATAASLLLLKRYALGWALVLCLLLLGTSGKVRTLTVEHLARGQEDRSLDTFFSHRLAMWDRVLEDYGVSVVGRGYAAGFRYDDNLLVGNAHNSLVELYFNVGLVGAATWLFFIGTVYRRLYRLWRASATLDYEFISVAGVMIFLLMKALAATVFVYLDASMLILAGAVIYVVRQPIPAEQETLLREYRRNVSPLY
jgi:O-antigen ligase